MKLLPLRELLVVALPMSLVFCFSPQAEAAKTKMECITIYKNQFRRGKMHKAMATTNGRSYRAYSTACGWASGYSSKAEAVRDALRHCARSTKANKIKGKCRVIAAE